MTDIADSKATEFAAKERLTQQAVASIEGQNWTDTPLTDDEKHLIGMAVDVAYAILSRQLAEAPAKIEQLQRPARERPGDMSDAD